MRKYISIVMLFVAPLAFVVGCDNYDRTEVKSEIFVNYQLLSLFIGQEAQLVASPVDGGGFQWKSEDTSVATVANGLVTAVSEGATDIIVSRDDMSFRVNVVVSTKIPLAGIALSASSLEMKLGGTASISVELSPINANDVPLSDFKWWSDDESVARVSLDGTITAINIGKTKIYYRKGSFTQFVDVNVTAYGPTIPFKGPHTLSKDAPYELFFRDFDMGGEGLAFHDDSSNSAGSDDYRRTNGDPNSYAVDIEGGANGTNIGWTGTGEWLIYTIEVKDAGVYNLRLQTANEPGSYYLELDGEKMAPYINASLPTQASGTGGWGNYKWNNPIELTFPAGVHQIKFYMSNATYNLMSMKFEFVR